LKTCLTALLLLLMPFLATASEIETNPCQSFNFSVETTVKGTPEVVFENITGDISEWWDHSFSEKPFKLYVDPFPGGAFMEIFDENGYGVRHAVVTAAQYGSLLRYEGPLGLAGKALFMVTTWTLKDLKNGQTLVTVEVHGSGEVDEGVPEIVMKTWNHFLGDRLKSHLEKIYKIAEGG
jgi:hypothetical protein